MRVASVLIFGSLAFESLLDKNPAKGACDIKDTNGLLPQGSSRYLFIDQKEDEQVNGLPANHRSQNSNTGSRIRSNCRHADPCTTEM